MKHFLKYSLLPVFLFTAMTAGAQSYMPFTDVWKAFTLPAGRIDSFLVKKGYRFVGKETNRWNYKRMPGEMKAVVSFTFYDSSRISGLSFEENNTEAPGIVKELLSNSFVFEEEADKNQTAEQGIQTFESARYMLHASLSKGYPRKGIATLNYAWHDLAKQSLVVVQQGNNPYLTDKLMAEYRQMDYPARAGKDSLYRLLTEPPVFKGGRRGLYLYLNSNVRYPAAALQDSVEAIIEVGFTVDTTGRVREVKILKGEGAGHGLPEEAIRLFNEMPLWRPAQQMGKPVPNRMRQVLLFKRRLNNIID